MVNGFLLTGFLLYRFPNIFDAVNHTRPISRFGIDYVLLMPVERDLVDDAHLDFYMEK